MKLFVGLGNPGSEHSRHRHNIGFMFVEYLKNKTGTNLAFKMENKFLSNVCEVTVKGEKYVIVEPQTFMNASGRAVVKLFQFYKVALDNLIVAHDELDIPLGKFKIQNGTGPKLHGGLASIEQYLGTKDFWRIRIGVEKRDPDSRIPGEAYVLQNFTPEEHIILFPTFEKIHQQLALQKIL